MGTHDTNDDAAMGLPAKRPITQYEDPANYEVEGFDEMTGPMGHVLPGGYVMPSKVHAVIRDEQRMADVFAECALAVDVMWQVQDALPGAGYERRLDLATRLSRAADSLESAIARANGGAA